MMARKARWDATSAAMESFSTCCQLKEARSSTQHPALMQCLLAGASCVDLGQYSSELCVFRPETSPHLASFHSPLAVC